MYSMFCQDDDDNTKIYEDLCSLRGLPKAQLVSWLLACSSSITGIQVSPLRLHRIISLKTYFLLKYVHLSEAVADHPSSLTSFLLSWGTQLLARYFVVPAGGVVFSNDCMSLSHPWCVQRSMYFVVDSAGIWVLVCPVLPLNSLYSVCQGCVTTPQICNT